MKYRVFLLLTLSLLLSACGGGGDGDSSDGGSAPATAEVLAPQARDSYDQLLTANQPNASNDVSLRDRVSDPQGLALRLLSVQPLTSQCQPPVVNSEALSFRVDNGSADACTYAYTVQNVPTNGASPKQTQATSYVVVSATSAPAMLPIISQTAVVNETITVDMVLALGGNFPTGFTLQPEVIVLGSGTAYADQSNDQIVYTAAAVPGITRVLYSYVSSDGSEVRAGSIDVSVSKSADGMPLAENFPGPEDVLPGAVVTVDVKDHISDPNGDPLQLTDAYAFDATVGATSKNDIANTKFDFVAEKPGVYDVTYYVTDHNGGYAIAVVRISVKADQLWSDIVLSDGSRYTAPWEKNLADSSGVAYQSFYNEVNDSGNYDVALFNQQAGQSLCAARGMTLPSLHEMSKLYGDKPDPSTSDNWPVARPFWTNEPRDSSNNGKVFSLTSGGATLESINTPANVTCVYSGILQYFNTIIDNKYISGTPSPDIKNVIEVFVTGNDGVPKASQLVYFYAAKPGIIFSQEQALTDSSGKARVSVESSIVGSFDIYSNLLTQTLKTVVTFIDNVLESLIITGENEVRVGQSIQLSATGIYSSHDSGDVTATATWFSSSGSMVTVASGIVTGITPGNANIYASQSGINAQAHPVTVFAGLNYVDVTPDTVELTTGNTLPLHATAYFDGNISSNITTTAQWSSSNATVASVSSSGVVTAKSPGTAMVQASYKDHGLTKMDMSTITVKEPVTLTSISVSPQDIILDIAETENLLVTANYSDGSSRLVMATQWSSSNLAVATVTSSGLVTAKSAGTALVQATFTDNGVTKSDNTTVTVKNPVILTSISLSPQSIVLDIAETESLIVTAHYSDGSSNLVTTGTTYSSSDSTVASVNGSGVVTGVKKGSSTISASYTENSITKVATTNVNVIATLSSLSVSPGGIRMAVGATQQLTVTAYYTDGFSKSVTTSASYNSSNKLIASVDSSGMVLGVAAGSTKINISYTDTGVTKTTTASTTIEPNVFGGSCNEDAIIIDGKVYTCPLNKGEADLNGISYMSEDASGFSVYMTYAQSVTYCENFLDGGYRVPNNDEMTKLYLQNPKVNNGWGYPNVNQDYYWSSTVSDIGHSAIDMFDGDILKGVDSAAHHLSCVRDLR